MVSGGARPAGVVKLPSLMGSASFVGDPAGSSSGLLHKESSYLELALVLFFVGRGCNSSLASGSSSQFITTEGLAINGPRSLCGRIFKLGRHCVLF